MVVCHGKCAGFTLVELLVVITILGILMGLLLAGGQRGPRVDAAGAVQE